MRVPVRHSGHGDHEDVMFTIVLERPLTEDLLKRIERVIESWYMVALYIGDYGLSGIGDIEYDEEGLWISWTVSKLHGRGPLHQREPVVELGRILERFKETYPSAGIKELVIGDIIEK